MNQSKCRLCGLPLAHSEAQTRSDDEAPTLVVSCPVHGLYHDLVFKFFNVISNNYNVAETSNPCRSLIEYKTLRSNLVEYPRSADVTSVQRVAVSSINMIPYALDEFTSCSDCPRAIEEVEVLGARWCRSQFKRVTTGFAFYNNPLYSVNSAEDLVYQEIVMQRSLSMSTTKIVDLTRCSLSSVESLYNLYSVNVIMRLEYEGWNIVMSRSNQYDTITGVAVVEDQDNMDDLCIHSSIKFQVACSALLSQRMDHPYSTHQVLKRYSWNVWRYSCLDVLSRIRLASMAVSQVNIRRDSSTTLISCRGNHTVICICYDFGVIINTSVTRATLLPILPRILESDKKMLIMRGYLDRKRFNLYSCILVDLNSNSCTYEVDHNLWMQVERDDDLEVVPVVKVQEVTENWRMIYPGSQESIMITRRAKVDTPRIFGLESTLCIIHRIIVLKMVELTTQGVRVTFFIKSKPFLFYKELTMLAPCIFVYEEDWESDDSTLQDRIDLSNSEYDEINCDYSDYESIMDLESAGSMHECRTSCVAGNPIHYNSASVSEVNASLGSNHILMDFYNQCPEESIGDCEYISVVGDTLLERSKARYWNMFESIEKIDLTNTDLEILCDALCQSLKNIHIIHTPALKSHMHI